MSIYPAPAGASIISAPYTYTDDWCFGGGYVPVVDPMAPAIVAPPQPPGIEWGMFNPPSVWSRRRVVIPRNFIPVWTDVAPIVKLYAPAAIRNVRIRFYADPLETGNMPVGDDCEYVADFVVTFIPLQSSMIIDVADRAIYLDVGGLRRRADSLVFGMDGGPFEWPTLTCGVQHIMTLDLPAGEPVPYVDLSFVERFI